MIYSDKLEEIKLLLSDGKIILTPTDTIWGLSCDATNEDAINRIYALKKRPKDKPLIILVSTVQMLKSIVPELHPRIQTLHHFHKKPVTIIYPGATGLAQNAISKSGTVAIRIVHSGFCHDLIQFFGKPITSTSANVSESPFPKNFGEISSEILNQVDYVVRAEREHSGDSNPSVVVLVNEQGELEVIRP